MKTEPKLEIYAVTFKMKEGETILNVIAYDSTMAECAAYNLMLHMVGRRRIKHYKIIKSCVTEGKQVKDGTLKGVREAVKSTEKYDAQQGIEPNAEA